LTPFVSKVVSNPGTMLLGTTKFTVIISPQCSGLEGAGLMLGFALLWLALFSHECRFPQALLLLPAGVLLIFALNAVRLAALVLVGTFVGRQVAAGGFHSQAGWILFNLSAVAFILTVRHVPWFTIRERPEYHDNPTAAYLSPFVATMIAGMIAAAATGTFEWWYPLRFVAAASAIWLYRRSYSALDWHFDWTACAAGVAVFLLWIGLDRSPGVAMPVALATSSAATRFAWILVRVLAATVTVPIAEELAFRGFLMRRFSGPDFEVVALQRATWFGLLASSVLFGALHGHRWWVATIAGLVFAWVARRKGRIGDAVVAHGMANALLAIVVLMRGQWQLW
jgi:exosortase E/protease (VPEID-CTERM system)